MLRSAVYQIDCLRTKSIYKIGKDFGKEKKYSKRDFHAEFKKNKFFENKIILKQMLTYADVDPMKKISKQILFKNIRDPESKIKDSLKNLQLYTGEKSGLKKHRNCSNQVHSCFCYIELLDARSILFNDVRIPNLETLQKLV